MIHPWHALRYGTFIAAEVISGAWQVGRDALTPGLAITPCIVEYPLRCQTDVEISAMASSITITPGTLTLGIAPASEHAPTSLFVHGLYAPSEAALVDDLRDMETRLLRATRGSQEQEVAS